MNKDKWEQWRSTRPGAAKQALLSQLVAENEALARWIVGAYTKQTQYYTDNLHDDLLQAARIGLMQAVERWDPSKGAFSLCAFHWMRHETQLVVRHATGVSVPKSAFLPKAKQDEIARFYALHGRDPEPAEVGLTATAMERARKATATFVPVGEADDVPAEGDSPEATIDRKRDAEALKAFIAKLPPKDRREFWAGTRPDLTERARKFVEGRRGR